MEKWYFIWKWYWKSFIKANQKWDKSYCQILGWKKFAQIFIMHQTIFWLFEWHEILCMNKRLCNSSLLRNWLQIYIFLKGNKLASFTNSEASFQIHHSVIFFLKKYHRKGTFLCGAHVTPKFPKSFKKLCTKIFNFLSL